MSYEDSFCPKNPLRGKSILVSNYGSCPEVDCPKDLKEKDGPPPGFATDIIFIMEKHIGFKVEKWKILTSFVQVNH